MKHFTDPEVLALPLELRCCYFVQAWNLNRTPPITDLDAWAEQVGWLAFYSNLDATSREEDVHAAALKAKERVARVLAFAESLLNQPSQ